MENFISCTIKKRLSYLSCIIIVSAIVILNIIERFAPIAFDVFFERPNEIIDYIFMATTVACAIFFIIAFFKSFKKVKVSDSENEYIDKNGFPLKDLFIPFCETEEIFKVIKKWGIIKLKIKTKKDEEYEIPTFGFYGDILYEMYLQKKIKA